MSEHLGDCLLHRRHHALSAECYVAISERFARYVLTYDLTYHEARDQYALDYEQACLYELLQPVIPPQRQD